MDLLSEWTDQSKWVWTSSEAENQSEGQLDGCLAFFWWRAGRLPEGCRPSASTRRWCLRPALHIPPINAHYNDHTGAKQSWVGRSTQNCENIIIATQRNSLCCDICRVLEQKGLKFFPTKSKKDQNTFKRLLLHQMLIETSSCFFFVC